MIIAGIKLTLLGMSVVFLFLTILILTVKLSFRFLSEKSAREFAEMEAAALNKKMRGRKKTDDDTVLVAVISAAIAAHRSRYRSAG